MKSRADEMTMSAPAGAAGSAAEFAPQIWLPPSPPDPDRQQSCVARHTEGALTPAVGRTSARRPLAGCCGWMDVISQVSIPSDRKHADSKIPSIPARPLPARPARIDSAAAAGSKDGLPVSKARHLLMP